jgi:hypothetical protein
VSLCWVSLSWQLLMLRVMLPFFAAFLQINCNDYSCVEGVWLFWVFNVSSISNQSFADASSSNITRLTVSVMPFYTFAGCRNTKCRSAKCYGTCLAIWCFLFLQLTWKTILKIIENMKIIINMVWKGTALFT